MLDLKFYIPDIRAKLNVLFKHFQQFSKLKLLKRNSFTCAKKNPLSFFHWKAFIFPCFHTKTWNLASKYKWYVSAAISKQSLNLLIKGVLHPPPLLVHRDLQSLWVEATALAGKGQKGLRLADDFCFDLTWVYGRCAQGAVCKPHATACNWTCVSSRNFLPGWDSVGECRRWSKRFCRITTSGWAASLPWSLWPCVPWVSQKFTQLYGWI